LGKGEGLKAGQGSEQSVQFSAGEQNVNGQIQLWTSYTRFSPACHSSVGEVLPYFSKLSNCAIHVMRTATPKLGVSKL
jgi:hypothetical protein